jgi:hypothetical protein
MTSLTASRTPSPRPRAATTALVVSGVVIAVSCIAVVGLQFSAFYWDPDDYPAAYYRDEVVRHQQNLQVALFLPAASLILAAIAWTFCARAGARIGGALWAAAISAGIAVVMILVAQDNIEAASRFAEMF